MGNLSAASINVPVSGLVLSSAFLHEYMMHDSCFTFTVV